MVKLFAIIALLAFCIVACDATLTITTYSNSSCSGEPIGFFSVSGAWLDNGDI